MLFYIIRYVVIQGGDIIKCFKIINKNGWNLFSIGISRTMSLNVHELFMNSSGLFQWG